MLYRLRDEWRAWDVPVIGFGGSYGGMIGAWFRLKYPNAVDGVLAASAPIFSFVGLDPPYDYDAFYRIVTRDASAAGGASDACAANVKRGLERVLRSGKSDAGRAALAKGFRMCSVPTTDAEVWAVKAWVEAPWATMAMGNYPYASTYLMHGHAMLPAWPVRAACKPLSATTIGDDELFDRLRRAVSIYYNASGNLGPCNPITAPAPDGAGASAPHVRRKMTSPLSPPHASAASAAAVGAGSCSGTWGYQWCTEMVQPFTAGTDRDMYYPYSPYDYNASAASCAAQWGVEPTEAWARIGLGGKRIGSASNIIFSNGVLDPWSGGGVLRSPAPSLHTLSIPSGAHHIDLMFSDPDDPHDVSAARQQEMAIIQSWIDDFHSQSRSQRVSVTSDGSYR